MLVLLSEKELLLVLLRMAYLVLLRRFRVVSTCKVAGSGHISRCAWNRGIAFVCLAIMACKKGAMKLTSLMVRLLQL